VAYTLDSQIRRRTFHTQVHTQAYLEYVHASQREVVMTDADRAAALAWAAGQLSWERRLRELEAAEDPTEESGTEPVRAPASSRAQGASLPLTR
jgi:hypothetical protein